MAEPPSAASPHGENGGPDDWPDDRWPDGDWPDDDWPDDTWPAGQPAAWPGAPPQPHEPGEPGLLTWLHSNVVGVALIAVLAGVAGAFLAFLLTQGPSAAPAAARTPAGLSPTLPGKGIGGGGVSGGLPGGGAGQVQMLLVGPVTAVSGTSITVAGQGNSVTGAVTSATKVTGKVTSIGGIKVGDHVLVKFTGNPASGSFTAITIQDPASIS